MPKKGDPKPPASAFARERRATVLGRVSYTTASARWIVRATDSQSRIPRVSQHGENGHLRECRPAPNTDGSTVAGKQ